MWCWPCRLYTMFFFFCDFSIKKNKIVSKQEENNSKKKVVRTKRRYRVIDTYGHNKYLENTEVFKENKYTQLPQCLIIYLKM